MLRGPKIAIGIPYYGDTRALFSISLAGMIVHACQGGVPRSGERVVPEIALFWATGSSIARNREAIVANALDAGAEYLLFLDTDHQFPPDTLARLFRHMGKVEVVACNQPRRTSPTSPTALNIEGGRVVPVYTTEEKAKGKSVEQVDRIGLAVSLIDCAVFSKVERPWFAASEHEGEDGYFFSKLATKGIKPFVDHHLSWEVGHVAERVLTNADALADQGQHKGA